MRILAAALATSMATAMVLPGTAAAQFDDTWVRFELMQDLGGSVYQAGDEADCAWDDLDNDGDVDLVVVVKEDFTTFGMRPNRLLVNEDGVLVDRTQQYAAQSDVAGDQGFLTPTNDRDVALPDVDVDGWVDVVTAVTASPHAPKPIGHPRVYRNLGGAPWQGLRHEAARFPQLVQYSSGLPTNPRFAGVAHGDLTGNGAPDLYFVDHDSSGAGGVSQPSGEDLNDRLLINDGLGFFTDQSQTRMTSQALKSAFGVSAVIADVNLDGWNDVTKDTALQPPQYVCSMYNKPANPGFFTGPDVFHVFAPYFTNLGDLNNDGRLDAVVSDDSLDRYRYNLATDSFGNVVWSDAMPFQFLSGSDDGFASNNLIVDLDADGWKDVAICDVDVDVPGYTRRLHIYHNRNVVPGGQGGLLEERQFPGTNDGPGWLGAVGLTHDDLRGMHDVAVFDVDGDGDKDLVLLQGDDPGGPFARVRVFENRTMDGPGACEPEAPIATQNNTNLIVSVCNDGAGLATGTTGTGRISGLAPGRPYVLVGGPTLLGAPVPELPGPDGTPIVLGPKPSVMYFDPSAPADGRVTILFPGGGGPLTFHVQALSDASPAPEWWASNTVSVTLLP